MLVPEVEAIVSKIYTLLVGRPAENFALLDKIRKFLADHLQFSNVFPEVAENPWEWPPVWCHVLANLSEMKHMIVVCRYVEPFRSYVLLTDGCIR